MPRTVSLCNCMSHTRFCPIPQETQSYIGSAKYENLLAHGLVNITGWPHHEDILALIPDCTDHTIIKAMMPSSLQVSSGSILPYSQWHLCMSNLSITTII